MACLHFTGGDTALLPVENKAEIDGLKYSVIAAFLAPTQRRHPERSTLEAARSHANLV